MINRCSIISKEKKHHFLNLLNDNISHVDKVISEIKNKNKVILYFHGGLSSNKYMQNSLGPLLLNTMLSKKTLDTENFKTHVVFMQYNAGFSLKKTSKILKIITKNKEWILLKKIFENKTPNFTFNNDIISDESKKNVYDKIDDYIENHLVKIINLYNSNNSLDRVEKFLNENTSRSNIKKYENIKLVFRKIKRRFLEGTDHGEATFKEEVLRMILKKSNFNRVQEHWEKVYRNAKSLWETESGKHFLSELSQLVNSNNSTNSPLLIDVLSHSAGSIPISYLLNSIKNTFKINSVIFIVPAIRMKLFQTHVLQNENRFTNFNMFLLDDMSEISDKLAFGLYPRSMLYFASGVAEEESANGDMTILGMERYHKNVKPYNNYNDDESIFGNINTCKQFLSVNNRKTLLSLTDVSQEVITTKGASHNGTKTPHKSPELAKKIIYLLVNKDLTITNDLIVEWKSVFKRTLPYIGWFYRVRNCLFKF